MSIPKKKMFKEAVAERQALLRKLESLPKGEREKIIVAVTTLISI